MGFVIFIVIIVVIIWACSNSSSSARTSYSNEDLINISRAMPSKEIPSDFPNHYVDNKEDFMIFWAMVTDQIYEYDMRGDKWRVNYWCYCVVKYCTEDVLRYGNSLHKSALINFVKLLKQNKLI